MQENNIIDIRNEDGKLVGRFCFETATLTIKLKDCVTDIRLPIRRRTGGDQQQDRITADASQPTKLHTRIHETARRQYGISGFPRCSPAVFLCLTDLWTCTAPRGSPRKEPHMGFNLWERKIPH